MTQPGGHGTLRKTRNGRGKQKELWRMRSSEYTEHGELGDLSYRREAKLHWRLWANSLFSQMRHTKSFWKCVLAGDRIPNPDGPKVKMEFISLHERDESRVAPAKLDLGVQTMSSDLGVIITSCLCFLLCQLHSSQASHTHWEIFMFTYSQVQVQENREMPHI